MAKINPIDLQKHLKGVSYPASKQDVIARATENGTDQEVQSTLERMSDEQFETPVDVNKAIGAVNDEKPLTTRRLRSHAVGGIRASSGCVRPRLETSMGRRESMMQQHRSLRSPEGGTPYTFMRGDRRIHPFVSVRITAACIKLTASPAENATGIGLVTYERCHLQRHTL